MFVGEVCGAADFPGYEADLALEGGGAGPLSGRPGLSAVLCAPDTRRIQSKDSDIHQKQLL